MSKHDSKLNLMKQRTFIPVSQFAGLQQKLITSTAAALTDLHFNVIDDDSAATAGTPVVVAVERGLTEQAMLWSDMANSQSVFALTDTGSLQLPVLHRPIDEKDLTVKYDANPTSFNAATELYVVPTGPPNPFGAQLGVLYCVNNANADDMLADDDNEDAWVVHDNNDIATMEIAGTALSIKFDDDGADTDNRLVVDNPTECDIYVMSKLGRPLKITHESTLAGTEPVLEFIDAGADGLQLWCASTNTADSAITTGAVKGWQAIHGWYLYPLYVDDDAATESERFYCTVAAAVDLQLFLTTENRMVKVLYDADPATTFDATLVYIDDNEADMTECFTSVTNGNADCTVQVDPKFGIYDDDGGQTAGTTAADTVWVSANTGNAPLVEINGLGLMGLHMDETTDLVSHMMLIPSEWDRKLPIGVRAIWVTASTTIADRLTWTFLYDEITPGTDAVIAAATVLDTIIAEDAVSVATAYTMYRSPKGVINPGSLADSALYWSFSLRPSAQTNNPLSDGVYLLGVEFEYGPRLTRNPTGAVRRQPLDWEP